MSNPMDEVPLDYGSDRYDAVILVDAPPNVSPDSEWVDRVLADACLDCNPNLYLYWRPWHDRGPWVVQVAHDDGCPMYAQLDLAGELGEVPPSE